MRLVAIDGWWGDAPLELPDGAEPVGYAWMVRQRGLDVMPHHRWSFVARVGARSTLTFQDITWETFPLAYQPAASAAQLEFALKYDGVNLEILRAWFSGLALDEVEALEAWVHGSPTSAYARRAWYLYELLTGRELALEDARTGAYVPVLDPERYHAAEGHRRRRHRVLDNLFGSRDFSPIIRRTAALDSFAGMKLSDRIQQLLAGHDDETLARVVSYLYTKETRSSFEMEREKPSTDRLKRFVEVLRQAHDWPSISKEALVRLQNLIVTDPRRRDADYRDEQNYVAGPGPREIAFVSPRPDDLVGMMTAWLAMLARLVESPLDPVVAATAVSFAFVYLHPFEDGNGRIHRFLVHYVLARKGFTPRGALVPVSASMLARMKEYDAALECFSTPVMVRLRYELDNDFRMEVLHDSSGYYRYPDLTRQAEALYGWVAVAVEQDVPKELMFMLAYRDARRRVSALVELPDRRVELLLARCLENYGKLSNTRRRKDFDDLSDAEVEALERAMQEAMREHGMETRK